MDHIFLSQSSTDGHLGCFLVLATVNSASVNTGCMHLFELEFFFTFEDKLSYSFCNIAQSSILKFLPS